jgi:transposase
MDRKVLTDARWKKIEDLLPGKASDPGCTAKDNRLFVEAVLWIARTGSPWRDLPAELGNWHTTYVRFARWRDSGVWDRVANALAGDAELERVFIDSTIVRAHQHAAGAQKNSARKPSGGRVAD